MTLHGADGLFDIVFTGMAAPGAHNVALERRGDTSSRRNGLEPSAGRRTTVVIRCAGLPAWARVLVKIGQSDQLPVRESFSGATGAGRGLAAAGVRPSKTRAR